MLLHVPRKGQEPEAVHTATRARDCSTLRVLGAPVRECELLARVNGPHCLKGQERFLVASVDRQKHQVGRTRVIDKPDDQNEVGDAERRRIYRVKLPQRVASTFVRIACSFPLMQSLP